jgi:hypothetical protein
MHTGKAFPLGGYVATLAGAALLAGCSGGGEKPPALKEGKWTITTSVSHVEGVSEDQARAMTSMNGQYSLCIDGQNAADGLRLIVGKALDGDCAFGSFNAGNGSSVAALSCTGKSGTTEVAASGKVTSEGLNLAAKNTATDPASGAKVVSDMKIVASTSKACT